MRIVVDDKIPYIRETLACISQDVTYLAGAAIGPDDVRNADALIVRTRTRCDEHLLRDSRVQFVATATIGYDHMDTDYLERRHIAWMNCPGCNAGSVAQYVESSLLLLERDCGLKLSGAVLGLVGCGHVGSRVKTLAERLGMKVLVCDPPLLGARSVSFSDIEHESDVITFHVPLTDETHHMANCDFFHHLPRVPYIINTSRGPVVDNGELLLALREKRVCDAVIDVWEGEPHVNPDLLSRVFIGTPHIAGYSADGKVNADNMVVRGLCRHFHLPFPAEIVPPSLPDDFVYTGHPLELYNPLDDSLKLKTHPEKFEEWRGNYPLRREKIAM